MTRPPSEPAPQSPGSIPEPAPVAPGVTPGGAGSVPSGLTVRVLDGLAGLLSAGMLLVGVLLLLAAVVAPAALSAAELGAATGPGWSRVAAHLAVGVVGELVVFQRRGWSPMVRAGADLAVIAAAVLVIGWVWWP